MNYRKILCSILVCLSSLFLQDMAYAQTNTFPSSGNVGIGTTSPTSPLSILSPSSDTGLKIGAVGKSTEIKLHVAGGEYGYFNLGGNTVLRGEDNPSYFEGKLGVGTTNPTELLTVNGTAKAEEIIVEENVGADFVFEKSYTLSSLAEVEQHIKANKHLPEIPSAQEMIANGVKVGELQMKLLQKVEELTLYVIELEKRDRIKTRNNIKLLRRIEILENRVSNIPIEKHHKE